MSPGNVQCADRLHEISECCGFVAVTVRNANEAKTLEGSCAMCNLYHHSVSAAALKLFAQDLGTPLAAQTAVSNFEADYVGADADGPVLVIEDGALKMRMRRWGFPSWKDGGKPITNIRNLDSTWWRGANGDYIEKPEYRCLVPFDRFAEWDSTAKRNAWFEVDAAMAFFAGFWRPWTGERLKAIEGKKRRSREVGQWELFAFLTTEPNETVAAIHPKAMPAIITTADQAQEWLSASADSLNLQRPLPDNMVTKQEYQDG